MDDVNFSISTSKITSFSSKVDNLKTL